MRFGMGRALLSTRLRQTKVRGGGGGGGTFGVGTDVTILLGKPDRFESIPAL